MGPIQNLEGMPAAIAFAKLKLKVTARDLKNSTLKLNILAFTSTLKCLSNLMELILVVSEMYQEMFPKKANTVF